MTMLGIVIADLMMLSRCACVCVIGVGSHIDVLHPHSVEVLWRRSRYYWFAVGILLVEWVSFVAINWWLLFQAFPEINDGRALGQDVISCTMIFDPR